MDNTTADDARDAEFYRFLRDSDNWGEDSGEDCWAILGESSGFVFDEIVATRMAKLTTAQGK